MGGGGGGGHFGMFFDVGDHPAVFSEPQHFLANFLRYYKLYSLIANCWCLQESALRQKRPAICYESQNSGLPYRFF